MNRKDLIKKVKIDIIKSKKTQAKYAEEIGISPAELCNFLRDTRNPPARLLAFLGLKEVTHYEKS